MIKSGPPKKQVKTAKVERGGAFDLRIFIILGKLKSLLYGNFVPENQKSREIVIFDKSDTSDPHETTSSKTFPSEPENLTLAGIDQFQFEEVDFPAFPLKSLHFPLSQQ